MDKAKEDDIGLYEPNQEEQEKCKEQGISCDFGICSECIIGSGKGDINVY